MGRHVSIVRTGRIQQQYGVEGLSMASNGSKPSSSYITLVSAEGFKVILPRSAAAGSKTINAVLTGDQDWAESQSGTVTLPTISTAILEIVAEYLIYKKYSAEGAPTGA